MRESRFVRVWSSGRPRRLVIRDTGAYLDLEFQRENEAGDWVQDGEAFWIPVEDSVSIADVAGAIVTMWEARRQEEMQKRTGR